MEQREDPRRDNGVNVREGLPLVLDVARIRPMLLENGQQGSLFRGREGTRCHSGKLHQNLAPVARESRLVWVDSPCRFKRPPAPRGIHPAFARSRNTMLEGLPPGV